MMFALLMNGASVVPLFVPLLPQVVLLLFVAYFGKLSRLPLQPATAIQISFVLLGLATWAALQSNSTDALRLYKLVGNSVVALFVARALTVRYGESLPTRYSNAILALSLVGVLGLVLSELTDWHLTAAIGDRVYQTNLLNVWLVDSGFDSSLTSFSPFAFRLQSYFDEPGTYGIVLIPALFHFLDTGEKTKAAILTLCVFFTESASAWFLAVLLIGFQATRLKRSRDKALVAMAFAAVAVSLYPYAIRLYEIKAGLDEAYLTNSSFGTRSLEYEYLFSHWSQHLVPLNAVAQAYAELGSISSSYVTWFIYGGLAFVIVMIWVAVSLTRGLWNTRRSGTSLHRFAFVLGAVLFSSGFQRTAFLDNIMFMSLFYWSLTQRVRRPRLEQALA